LAAPDFVLPDWERLAGPVTASARLRHEPGDFRVDEVLGFEPSGDGQHDFLRIEKTLLDTDRVARIIARFAGVPRRAVSYSGLKDRRAITRQWFSVEVPARDRPDWRALDADGLVVLEVAQNRRKLRRGAHRENAFELVLRDVDDPEGNLPAALETVLRRGFPNYFGEQRFGRGGGNIPLAQAMFGGRRLRRAERSIAISAARSLIFNDILSSRVADGSWDRVVAGDVANLDGSGSLFDVDGVDDKLRERCRRFDIHPTGSLWGRGAPGTGGRVGEQELLAAERYPGLKAGLERTADEGRRALRARAVGFTWEWTGRDLRLCFRLTRGAYATSLVRELVELR